jgi:recombinational DNA repair protein RecT
MGVTFMNLSDEDTLVGIARAVDRDDEEDANAIDVPVEEITSAEVDETPAE